MTTIDKTSKRYKDYLTMRKEFKEPVKFKGCPDAMKFLGYGTVKLAEVAPISREFHDGVRVDGVDDASVRTFMNHLEDGSYDPTADLVDPPCVVALPKNSAAYKDGYRYRMSDGFTRCEAHRRLDMETMEVAFIEFHDAEGETAAYWMLAFMIEKNDPKKRPYHSVTSTEQDQLQQARLLITTSMNSNPPKTLDELKVVKDNALRLTGIRKNAEKTKVWDYAVNLFNTHNPDNALVDIVHPYTSRAKATHINELCKVRGIDDDDVLKRNFSWEDAMGSRYDFDQVDILMTIAMSTPTALKKKHIVGTISNADYQHKVKEGRARKSQMISFFVKKILRWAKWLENPKNRKLLESIPVLFFSQVSDDPEDGSIFTVDPKTGDAVTVMNRE